MTVAPLELGPTAEAALLTVAAHGLGEIPMLLQPGPWTNAAGDGSLLLSMSNGSPAFFFDRAVADGTLPVTPSQADDAEAVAAQALRAVLQLERSLVRVADRLERASIPFLVLKGPAVARLDEAEPALRNYADIDILVRGHDIRSAVRSLSSLGYRRDLPERRPGFDRCFAKEVSLANERASELDLHRTLALGAFGLRIDLATLWGSTVAFDLGGTQLAALDAEGRFVHACFNAMLGDDRPRLVALRDVVRTSMSHELRPERLRAIVPPGRGAAIVAVAVETCRSTLGAEVGAGAAAFAREAIPSRWERVVIRAYRAHGGSNTLELLSGALGVRGAHRLHYLRALVAPQPAYREAPPPGRPPEEWRSGLREVVQRGAHGRGDVRNG